MRCPDCSKFVSMENSDPEVNDISVVYNGDHTFTVTAEVRLVRACADCGTELKDRTAYLEDTIKLSEFSVDGNGILITKEEQDAIHTAMDTLAADPDVEDCGDATVDESGGGRYAKNMLTLTMSAVVSITVNGVTYEGGIKFTDEAGASEYDECC